MVDGLKEGGYAVHQTNTAAIQQYEGLKYADHYSDVRWLWQMLRLELLPEGFIYPEKRGRSEIYCAVHSVRHSEGKRNWMTSIRPRV